MAINSNSVLGDKNPLRSFCSSKSSNLSSCRLIKINFAGKDSCSSSRAHGANINKDIKSPYFTNDKVQMLSRVTSKKVINKKPTDFMSSFPLAASVYKANSDEFKLRKRNNNKVKKSVLTLPNEPVPTPKTYAVSDLNDSEYFNAANDTRVKKSKKRRSIKHSKKSHMKEHSMEFCDRDARYCSQLNIDLDCSSSEILNFTGDGEKISKVSYKSNNSVKAESYPHDVWAVLRNINKFQFRPSPPESQKSIVPLRKRRPLTKKSNNNNDTHFIETCHTEEFAYISSFEVDSKTHDSCSPSSSFDRVTVIDKQSEQDEIIQQLSRNIFGSNTNFRPKLKSNINNQIRAKTKPRLRNGSKKVPHPKKKTENYQSLGNTHNKISQLEQEKVANESCNKLKLFPKVTPETSSIVKPIENCSDNSSIKENDSDQPINFGKCDAVMTRSPIVTVNVLKPMGDSEKQFNGITKVILSKDRELTSPKLLDIQRKPRLALTLPNTNIPKLSRFEIKRRLANQKFPIVILGKDQITNRGICVANVDSPQFDGLDNHIWPFMLEWSEDKNTGNIQDIEKKEFNKSKNPKIMNKVNHHNSILTNMNDLPNQKVDMKKGENKKKKCNTLPTTSNQLQLTTEVSSNIVQKTKPLLHLKNKMFSFLHKKPTTSILSENKCSNNQQVERILMDKQIDTNETMIKHNIQDNKTSLEGHHIMVTDKPVENKIVQKPYSPLRHPWAKRKWSNDFIENIIKKIRNGVYYGVDHKESKHRIKGTEVFTQTEINASKNAYCQNGDDFYFVPKPELKKEDPLEDIPGFDKTLSTLEIETISTNEIAVKHCVTNVVVHFDIQVMGDVKNLTHTERTMSCIPIDGKDKQEKVFKCNTSIINAILPAELCSIIPTMMRNILDAEILLQRAAAVENVRCHSKAVSEFMGSENSQTIMNSVLPSVSMSDDVRPFLNGRFQNSHANYKNITSVLPRSTQDMDAVVTFFPKLNTQILCPYIHPSVVLHISTNTSNKLIEQPSQEINKIINHCKALQRYDPKKFSLVPFFGFFNTTNFMQKIVDGLKVNEINRIEIIYRDVTYSDTNIIISRPLLFPSGENQGALSLPLSSNKVFVISLFNALKKRNELDNDEVVNNLSSIETNIEENTEIPSTLSDEGKTFLRKKVRPNKILRKKSYVKFYRKCNSMSSISNYKCTPLNRVTNLEEFCQVLGTTLFCNVLDGCLEKKIMGAIEELKNWITEICSKQALLILLLINKKDTPNLIRFRPVLLQGIAVNRITKADELDTEIEVIERENFHKLPQYEGISYLPASPKNQDSLLEELYWIAKTTASDYQKTFDESSEKLLKSLLEKRKKLNPSYLRVMARYVGLGLLIPTKL